VVTVMGLSDDATISESAMTARRYGAKVRVDLMNVPDKVARAKRSAELGASYVCLHVGIDEQMKARSSPLDLIKEVVRSVDLPVAVAGGINQSNARDFVKAGASIIIVGGAIIKAEDVRAAAKALKKAMSSGGKEAKAISKKYGMEELYQAFAKASTAQHRGRPAQARVMSGILPHIAHGQRHGRARADRPDGQGRLGQAGGGHRPRQGRRGHRHRRRRERHCGLGRS